MSTMSATLRFKPLAIIFADGNAVLSTKGYTNVAQPNASTTLYADTTARINAAIAEVNLYYQSYGYATSPNLPALPTVPAGANARVYNSLGTATSDVGISQHLVDIGSTQGASTPSTSLDAILTEPALANIKLARANLDAGKS